MLTFRLALPLLLVGLLAVGCKGGTKTPLTPGDAAALPPTAGIHVPSQRALIGAWDVEVDLASGQVTVTPERDLAAHVDLWPIIRDVCPECLDLAFVDTDPDNTGVISLTATLHNRFDAFAYDVRAIIVANSLLDPSSPYDGPVELLDADGYTPWFDDKAIPLNFNPFRNFAENQPERKFGAGESHSADFFIRLPQEPRLPTKLLMKVAVDCSVPANTEEPLFVDATAIPSIDDVNAIEVTAEVFDWQSDLSAVTCQVIPGGQVITLSAGTGAGVSPQFPKSFTGTVDISGLVGDVRYFVFAASDSVGHAGYQGWIDRSQVLPATGGTVTMGSVTVTADPDSLRGDVRVSAGITSDPAAFPAEFLPLGPTMDIRVQPQANVASPLELTFVVPVDLTDTTIPVALHFDTALGSYEPALVVEFDPDDDTLTVLAGQFSPFVLGRLLGEMPASFHVSGFSAVNEWPFRNDGSLLVPDGECLGMATYCKWLAEEHLEVQLNSLYPEHVARPVATRAHLATAHVLSKLQVAAGLLSQPSSAMNLMASLVIGGRPVVLGMYDLNELPFAGHAVVALGFDASGVQIYDVNKPGVAETIPWQVPFLSLQPYAVGSLSCNAFIQCPLSTLPWDGFEPLHQVATDGLRSDEVMITSPPSGSSVSTPEVTITGTVPQPGLWSHVGVYSSKKPGSFLGLAAVVGAGFEITVGLESGTNELIVVAGSQALPDIPPIPSSGSDAITICYGECTDPPPAGTFQSVHTWGGPSTDIAYSIALDGTGNVTIGGGFSGTADFNPGGMGGSRTSAGNGDGYLLRLDPSGTFQWVTTWGGPSSDDVWGVVCDSAGNVAVVGSFSGTADFNPSGVGGSRTSEGGYDGYLLHVGPDGAFQGVTTWGGPSEDRAIHVACDSAGNVAIVGYFWGTADFNPGGAGGGRTSAGEYDGYLLHLGPDGTFQGVEPWGGPNWDHAYGVDLDSAGNVGVVGFFSGNCDFNPVAAGGSRTSAGVMDGYLLRLDPTGAFQGVTTWGGPGADAQAWGVAFDGAGNHAVVGHFVSTCDFNPGGAGGGRTSAGSYDGYLLRLDSAGAFLGVTTWGGQSSDYSRSAARDAVGNVGVAGFFEGRADFNPGGAGGSRTNAGDGDGYLLRLGSTGAFQGVTTWGGPDYDVAYGVALDSVGNATAIGMFQGTVDFNLGGTGGSRTSAGGYDGYLLRLGP